MQHAHKANADRGEQNETGADQQEHRHEKPAHDPACGRCCGAAGPAPMPRCEPICRRHPKP
ncbi:MAG: hypothetical protein CPSOU_3523 [uncultured Paraburkholderia sp.]|nr:MAG: hypothetical protein CPSOU_3523 [uncultured Paraburkholderia sp.]